MAANLKSEPRWRAIHRELRGQLSSYRFGDDYHTISDLCQRFDVSKITAIRVLDELANEGVIEKIRGRGNVVRQVTQPYMVRLLLPARARHVELALDPVIRRLLDGIAAAAGKLQVDYNILSEANLQSLFPRSEGDFGFLVLRQISRDSLAFLRSHGLPFILVDPLNRYRGLSHVRSDRRRSGYLATRHLLDLGHRNIAYITGLIEQRNVRQRVQGYRQALTEDGVRFRWSMIRQCPAIHEEVETAFESLWRQPVRPTAVMAGDDTRAIVVLEACRRMGIDVPGQLSVVSYPNHADAALSRPALTAVDAHFERIAHAAVQRLLERMTHPGESRPLAQLIEPELVLRQTTAAPPAAVRRSRRSRSL
jgi:DNA-binding LacI/PurR family transcriptional regulator